MANLLFAGDVRVEVDEDKIEEIKYALVIQCDSPEELRTAIANRKMIGFSLFSTPPNMACTGLAPTAAQEGEGSTGASQ